MKGTTREREAKAKGTKREKESKRTALQEKDRHRTKVTTREKGLKPRAQTRKRSG